MTSDNLLFPMGDEGQWVYRVRIYLIDHSQLQIEVSNRQTSQILYLNFTGVEFYEGPLDWSGKGFSIGDTRECLQILKSIGAYADDDDNTLLDEFSLFMVEPDNGYRIRVVAGGQPTLTEENLFSGYIPS